MSLRNLPSVDRLLQANENLVATYGRPLTVKTFREELEAIRADVVKDGDVPTQAQILKRVKARLENCTRPTLEPVINATGVILHTNLGRAPLSKSARAAMDDIAGGYSNLEFDLASGKRGSRLIHTEAVLKNLTGAEAALVVNNCASAVLLVLTALANRKQVIIPRSQLVEIGGGFRVPDVMKQSGAKLVEIGTTNKVRLSDFDEALAGMPAPAVVMRAHRSNFKIIGFTDEPELKPIVEMAHKYGSHFIDDLGSGALLDTSKYGMSHEPMVQESLAAGADVIMFSGDKLVGGPQAGIILGKAELIAKIKKHPLARAVRADKSCLAGLSATLMHYLKDEAEREVPVWQMVSRPLDKIKAEADNWQKELGFGEVIASESTVGGGSLPGENLPTWVLALPVKSADKFLSALRKLKPAVIARTQGEQVCLDPRTLLNGQEITVLESLRALVPSYR